MWKGLGPGHFHACNMHLLVNQQAGSGNFAEDGATDDNEAGEGGVPDSHIVPTMSSPVYPGATATPVPFSHNHNSFTENPSQHHHRHHHGDIESGAGVQDIDNPVEEFRSSRPDSGPLAPYLSSSFGGGGYPLPSSPVLYASIMPTPTLVGISEVYVASIFLFCMLVSPLI